MRDLGLGSTIQTNEEEPIHRDWRMTCQRAGDRDAVRVDDIVARLDLAVGAVCDHEESIRPHGDVAETEIAGGEGLDASLRSLLAENRSGAIIDERFIGADPKTASRSKIGVGRDRRRWRGHLPKRRSSRCRPRCRRGGTFISRGGRSMMLAIPVPTRRGQGKLIAPPGDPRTG